MSWKIGIVLVGILATTAFVGFNLFYTIKVKFDAHPHRSKHKLELIDDQIADINPEFDPDWVDKRMLDGWEVNSSSAVVRLDCPDIRTDRFPALDRLYPSYAEALAAAEKHHWKVLPSANLIDGAAKQFDDGLYAAIDLAMFNGELGVTPSSKELLRSIYEKLENRSPARAFIAAGFSLIGEELDLDERLVNVKERWISEFESDQIRSKPIGFYCWSKKLEELWRFSKFFQKEFSDLSIPRAVSKIIFDDKELHDDYRQFNEFFGKLSNPPVCLSLDQLKENSDLNALAAERGVNETVAFFPASTSRETELFNRIFEQGLPQNVSLMAALIQRVLSGEVDLTPRKNSGWYDHQIFALETMLLPSRGDENNKLLLTAKYKKRLLEAFKAMITKRRETHARQSDAAKTAAERPRPTTIEPRLRVEPCATYYLRTARAYGFLGEFLRAVAGEEKLDSLFGIHRDGLREKPLDEELAEIRNRFYGLYLVSCDDIGMKPDFVDDEPVDQDRCYEQALVWLAELDQHRDFEVDTRVSVPILYDVNENKTRLWATIGVRLARLTARYEVTPRIRQPAETNWTEMENGSAKSVNYLIAVDQFAEVTRTGSSTLTRDELRTICDQHSKLSDVIDALNQ